MGLSVRDSDYDDMASKCSWRIVGDVLWVETLQRLQAGYGNSCAKLLSEFDRGDQIPFLMKRSNIY